MNRVVTLAWTGQGNRCRDLAELLGGRAVVLHRPGWVPRLAVPIWYLLQGAATIGHLVWLRPRVLLVQLPPVIPGLIGVAFGKLTSAAIVLDAHPASFGLKGRRSSRIQYPVVKSLFRRAQAVLVTVPELADQVLSEGGDAIVFHEPPPRVSSRCTNATEPGAFRVLFPSVFASDEPIDQVFKAAQATKSVTYMVTGDTRKLTPEQREGAPSNVVLTGFLDREQFDDLVASCDAVLSLSSEQTSVMRSAYEAVYAHRILITSDWQHLRAIFPYAVFTRNDASSIGSAVLSAARERERLRAQAGEADKHSRDLWARQARALSERVPELVNDPVPG